MQRVGNRAGTSVDLVITNTSSATPSSPSCVITLYQSDINPKPHPLGQNCPWDGSTNDPIPRDPTPSSDTTRLHTTFPPHRLLVYISSVLQCSLPPSASMLPIPFTLLTHHNHTWPTTACHPSFILA